ncbi:hypothetical protein L2E82_20499 [Cichorium intybus]|uniref:Uncharacterized protein n=1 Tax=Cichorium intybus TaxID=13427 RepID=A0ACB9DTV0_CICIN|nr:hypothetical protein L2E82_20499 [Cichorium intybus]
MCTSTPGPGHRFCPAFLLPSSSSGCPSSARQADEPQPWAAQPESPTTIRPLVTHTSTDLLFCTAAQGRIYNYSFVSGEMKLVQGVLRSLAAGISPSCHGFSVTRTLATSSASAIDPYANTNSSETLEDFERSIFGDLPGSSPTSHSLFQKLDQQKKAIDRSRMNGPSRRSGFMDGLDESFTSLTDGMDGKLKEAATYFEYDVNEVEKDDYKFRSDVTFWPGNTYDVKDLDLTKPGIRKPSKRLEFEVTTQEVLQKADFRNVRFLANFITEAGVIIKRSKTKISAKAQRKIAREIKTARAFGLMPFTTMGTKHFIYGRTMQDLDKDYEYEVYDQNFVDSDAS